jgi:cyanophycin synthetase
MTKFGVMSILRRYPPFVVGNSTSNISQLIDDENLIRTRMDLLPIVGNMHLWKNRQHWV